MNTREQRESTLAQHGLYQTSPVSCRQVARGNGYVSSSGFR